MLIFILFFVFATSALTYMLARGIQTDISALNSLSASNQAYLTAESLAEDVAFRNIWTFAGVDDVEVLAFGNATATATTTEDSYNETRLVESSANLQGKVREATIELAIGAGSAFNYGLQSGNGGITMANSASVVGNVFSNGPIQGSTGGGKTSKIYGDAISAGPTGLIDNVHATGTSHSNTLSDSLIDGDAYYNVVGDPSVVLGTRNTPATNLATSALPILEETIDEWEQAVLDYGTVIASTSAECAGGTYTIDSTVSIGYLKIECNLDIEETGGDIFITMTGPVWVTGNISFTQGPQVNVDPSLGRFSTQFIADNPDDRITSSKVEIRNSTTFQGSGDPRSIVLLVSRNESASLGGTEPAMTISQSANGDIMFYSNFGLVDIKNGIDLKEVTAYQISIAQNSDVLYDSGLANVNFTSGPGGGYVLTDWAESY